MNPENEDCKTCGGEGKIPVVESFCGDCDHETPCMICQAKGDHETIIFQDCNTCDGKGYLTPLDLKYLRLEAIENQY